MVPVRSRIGQGIEFDYCTVHAVQALRDEGVEVHIVNNNPETVSTDFDTSDRLFFEPMQLEDVVNILRKDYYYGVMVQFGGQNAVIIIFFKNVYDVIDCIGSKKSRSRYRNR